jgi:hypothetical protein
MHFVILGFKGRTVNQQTNFPQFPRYACEGDSIEWSRDGFDLRARLVYDDDTDPTDSDCYETADIERWRADEWFYVGVVLSVSRNGVELSEHAASLWGIDCNFSDTSNAYLSEVARELEAEALETARAELARIREALTE